MKSSGSLQSARRPASRRRRCSARRAWDAVLAAALLPLGAACSSPPISPAASPSGLPAYFRVEASGEIRLDDIRVPGRAWLDYLVQPDGSVTITALRATMRDLDIVTRFLFFDTDRERLRCTEFSNVGPIAGRLAAGGTIAVPSGAASLTGRSFAERAAGGGCTGLARQISAVNDRPLTVDHDPGRDRFRFSGSFTTTHRDRSFDVAIEMAGSYVNRPPIARIGVGGPGLDPELIQAGCPPLAGVNPPAADANDPAGLRLNLVSVSSDPDGSWGRSSIEREQWAHSTGGPFHFLGEGRVIGPVLFELDRDHRLELTVSDHLGARSRHSCQFRVADASPPTLTPPAPVTVRCSVPDGATPDTSSELAAFLAGATAADRADPEPLLLTPKVGGVEVAGSTLFPLGATTPVTFLARDRSGHVASELSAVTVAPRLRFWLPLPAVDPTLQLVPVTPRFEIGQGCGALRVVLESIRSSAPQLDPDDIVGAEIGSDDREFMIRARPAPGGRERVFEITYAAVDDQGREERHSEWLVVRGGQGQP